MATHGYSADGYLTTVTIDGALGAKRVTDVLGRMTSYTEYQTNGTTVLSTRASTYDADNRITTETTQTYNAGTTYTSATTNSYSLAGVDQGVITGSVNTQTQTGSSTTVTTTNGYTYTWWNQAKAATATVSGSTTGTATSSYDANGNLSQVNDSGINRVVSYQTDSFGQVLSRKETNNGQKGAWRNFFYLEGHVVGDVGNDALASQVDYAQQLATNRLNAAYPSTTRSTMTPVVGVGGNFDQNYQALNPTSVAQSAGGYTVMLGDTLQSIAQNVWGDASLWFLLADANGLSAGATLATGRNLIVPGKVANIHNASGVFKPYNAMDALSNTNPTLPKEPKPPAQKQGCGVVGDIIAVVVAVVVTAVVSYYAGPDVAMKAGEMILRGALVLGASDLAYQGTRMAVGNQKNFNWTQLAASAISGGIAGGAGLLNKATNVWDAVGKALQVNNIRQHVNMAMGEQKKFDWTGLAVAGITGGVSYQLSGMTSIQGLGRIGNVLTGTASALAAAATKSLLTGQSFGQSLKEVLPDAVASTVGNLIGGAIVEARETSKATNIAKEALKRGTGLETNITRSSNGKPLGPLADIRIDTRNFDYLNNLNFDSTVAAVEEPTYFDRQAALNISDSSSSYEILQSQIGDVANIELAGYQTNARVVANRDRTQITATWEERGENFTRTFVAPRGWRLGFNNSSVWSESHNDPRIKSDPILFSSSDSVPEPSDILRDADWKVTSFSCNDEATWNSFVASQYRSSSLDAAIGRIKGGDNQNIAVIGGKQYYVVNTPTTSSLVPIYNWSDGSAARAVAETNARIDGFRSSPIGAYLSVSSRTFGASQQTRDNLLRLGANLEQALPVGAMRQIRPNIATRPAISGSLHPEIPARNITRGGFATQGVVTHGNSKLSPRPAYLYELYSKDGTFLKNGVTQNLDTRYTKSFMADKDIYRVADGPRADMLALERQRTIANPGPLNLEPHAVKARAALLQRGGQ